MCNTVQKDRSRYLKRVLILKYIFDQFEFVLACRYMFQEICRNSPHSSKTNFEIVSVPIIRSLLHTFSAARFSCCLIFSFLVLRHATKMLDAYLIFSHIDVYSLTGEKLFHRKGWPLVAKSNNMCLANVD